MFYEIRALTLLTLISELKCSVVLDALGQKALFVSNYCPKMTYCPEGAHVMCMYHDPKHKYGPRCNKPRKVETTPAMAKLFLYQANKLRAEIAQGTARGKGKAYLPRGYGIYRLKWDEELATFAQLLANQCMLKHDFCRSTSRFPDPGQTVGLCRLSYPEWLIVKPRKFQFSTPGLTSEKLFYSINQSAVGWTGQKALVTPNMIRNYPDWDSNPKDRGGKLYMDIVTGDSKYMGCGISAYTEFAIRDGNPFLFNSVLVICNFSARGKKGYPLFKTVRPTSPEFTPACGCPIDEYTEDDECLCIEKKKTALTKAPEKLKQPVCSENDMNCEPTVVLLPIFTVEDAPPQKLIARERPYLSEPQRSSIDIIDIDDYDNAESNNNIYQNMAYRKQTIKPMVIDPHRYSLTVRPFIKKKSFVVKNRHFNKPPPKKNQLMLRPNPRPLVRNSQTNRKTTSIFTRVQKFQLPRNGISSVNIKKDVIPRKDFSSIQKLVDEYLNSRRSNDLLKTDSFPNQYEVAYFDPTLTKKDTHEIQDHTETFLNTAEERVINYNQYLKMLNATTEEPKNVAFKNINEDSDNKLMALLNTLEQEVKHIQLHGDEKELFDAKIRKIYGSVVGKPVDLIAHKKADTEFIDHDMTNYIKHKANNYLPIDDVIDRKIDQPYETDRMKGFETDKRIIEDKDHTELLKSYDKPMHSKYDRPTNIARTSRFRDLNSDEDFRPKYFDRYAYDGVKNRNTYSEAARGLYRHRDDGIRMRRAEERLKNKNFYLNDMNDDPLMSVERRRYYQEKLDNLEKRLHNTRSYKRLQRTEPDADHHLRAMRPSRDDLHGRSKNQIDSYYMPERARYNMHGF